MALDRRALNFIFSVDFMRMGILWTLAVIFSQLRLLFRGISIKTPAFPRVPPNPSTRPVCIITGATSGLGKAAAHALSMERYFVILAGRSDHLLSKTIEEIKQQQEDAHLKAFQVDVSSLASILNFKNSVQQWLCDLHMHPSIQLLVNNAGILATSRRFTAEGYDKMMGTNYMGAFSMANVLLPLLKNSSKPSRIVNVTSFTHHCVSGAQFDEESLAGRNLQHLSSGKSYPLSRIYEYSKLCVLLFSYELHRQLFLADPSHHISVMAADPGVVRTNIMREVPQSLAELAYTALDLLCVLNSPESGVQSIIDAALAPPEASGHYFFGGKGRTLESTFLSYDPKLSKELWISSNNLLQKAQLTLQKSGEISRTSD
ncbi:hypothetical protein AMTRI_Chr06g176890 [Amborella trichopoda]|uniref:Uncharacterized protein n=1 Tax=Amborella trichopoda TaxID=13333 RepID=W1Q080_AMBTC|nr:dehydrogenase/reductase SDR family member on chromosome X [Amborella trichopoda]XP_011626174.1 dehydrogenase/reductase SDR family member on chromosome X [Amborella trichopoda]XP_020527701.1 dehydrogenase/reductase SDR family member on chromosome X [Amborella trichopoda]XP_020527702.1 dehydrogenase/reductase SDR family member on chromosome X [Amborella trichopoda]ERN13771.1 hypothetical protein AMTR_s00049p00191150 [Amborella trichopoda]|eukprot:XP_006852304.1 dehydrogenase/reductase SDR family member on chromosome X [Amborella trichopoda]